MNSAGSECSCLVMETKRATASSNRQAARKRSAVRSWASICPSLRGGSLGHVRAAGAAVFLGGLAEFPALKAGDPQRRPALGAEFPPPGVDRGTSTAAHRRVLHGRVFQVFDH